jgi:hypothetical protein
MGSARDSQWVAARRSRPEKSQPEKYKPQWQNRERFVPPQWFRQRNALVAQGGVRVTLLALSFEGRLFRMNPAASPHRVK